MSSSCGFAARLLLSLVPALWLGCGRLGIELEQLPSTALDGSFGTGDAGAPMDANVSSDALGPGDTSVSGEAVDAFGGCVRDSDGDGVCEPVDNCPLLANPGQLDRNSDGVGDACDADGDGRPDAIDRCPNDAGDDSDGDGVCDGSDACPSDPNRSVVDACGCDTTAPLGLAAYWALDETGGTSALDAIAGRAGVLRNAAPDAWQPGRVGNALSFDGADDRLDIGDVAVPLRALSFWIRPATFAPLATETPWLSPTANGQPTSEWANPEGAYRLGDGRYSDGGLINGTSHDFHGFRILLPSAAVITGVQAEVFLRTNNPSAVFDIRLSWSAGREYTARRGTPIRVTPIDEYFRFGGPGDRWGHAGWSAAQLVDANFRVQLIKTGAPGSPQIDGVDHIQVKVHHSEVPLSRTVLALGAGGRVELGSDELVLSGFPSGTQMFVDGVQTTKLDGSWHHVVIDTPSAVTATNLQLGSASDSAFAFHGALDELKLFSQPLRPVDITTLRSAPACR